MKRVLILTIATLVAAIAVLGGTTTAASSATGKLSIVGPWTGADAASFRAVLARFTAVNPGVSVTYTPASGDVPTLLKTTRETANAPDLAVLSLPRDSGAMVDLARAGTIKSINFAVPALRSNYAYSWKALGSVDNNLFGLAFKATNRSAMWYDAQAFRNRGLKAPQSWARLRAVTATLAGEGLPPLAISAKDAIALPDLFSNIYLMIEGNQRYDDLMNGKIRWTDSSVAESLKKLRELTSGISAGSLRMDYPSAVQEVFGSPLKAAMLPGGSAALPVLYAAKAVRPLSAFDAFAFPRINAAAPPRIIGDADAVVMTRDGDAARALVSFLATPEAGTIWANRGGFFLSPNRKINPAAYGTPAIRSLATSLAAANVFRFAIADTKSTSFKQKLNSAIVQYLTHPTRVKQITSGLDAAANTNT
jgi:alpha-glucoside transport system substrate-binding protein